MTSNTEVRVFYNQTLSNNMNSYEQSRWFSSSEKRAGYVMTLDKISKLILPRMSESASLLEIGAGPGVWTKILLNKYCDMNIDIVDLSDEMLKQAKDNLSEYKNITYVRSDFEKFDIDRKYDFIFSSRAIEYMSDIDVVAKKMFALLNNGGTGFIITKYPHYLRSRFRNRNFRNIHKKQISPDKLAEKLKYVGFEIEDKKAVTMVFPFMRFGGLDLALYKLFSWGPLWLVGQITESYIIVFTKK
jgi:ubiquinone/menaquinone biosynthesis C-methylase UbiE